MRLLNLPAGIPLLDAEKKANQTEHNADRLAVAIRGLHGERVHHMLQDESGAAHRVHIDLVVRGIHSIHIQTYSTEEIEPVR